MTDHEATAKREMVNRFAARIEECLHQGGTAREAEANARLIAAAPDMLLALTWLVGIKDIRPSDYEEQRPLAWGAARAAIAKATGA